MTGKIFIVGTPIGNFNDITLRAIETLKFVDYIACEDKRVSIKLLNHFGIKSKLITYHNFNEKNSAKGIIDLIQSGNNVAIISDAGMPTISDPGFEIIKESKNKNIEIEFIPGVSAVTTSFAISNFGNSFSFMGFFREGKAQVQNQISSLKEGTYIFFVAPHKLKYTLECIDIAFEKNVNICLVKELTKKFERHFFGTAKNILSELDGNYLGEFTMVLNVPKTKRIKINKYKKEKHE